MRKYKKYKTDDVKQLFCEQGCILIESSYVNTTTLMRYQCSCGEISKITLKKFLIGQRCKKCGHIKRIGKTRHKYEDIHQLFKMNECELLDTEYYGCHELLHYRCR